MSDKTKPNPLRVLLQLMILIGLLVLLLFLPAGTWQWPQAWLFIIFITIYFLLYIYLGIYRDPDQTQERSQMAGNVKKWDKVIMTLYTILLPTAFIIAGLDVGRLEFLSMPFIFQGLSWLGLAFAGAIILWTVTANTFLSRYARIQDDREQEVIITGPYRFIRHPMYLGIIILFTCLGPALGSILALIPGFLISILFIIRTSKEDKMLQDELEGYSGYTQQVKYRLIPGIW